MKRFCVLAGIGAATIALGVTPPNFTPGDLTLDNDAYVVLYKRRSLVAQAEVERQKAQVRYSQAHYHMLQQIYERGAGSLDEYNEAKALYDRDVEQLKQDELKKLEADSMVDIARIRIGSGLDMPICPVEKP